MASLTLLQQLLAVLCGMLVGFTLGLIGGGGSILAVPLLLYVVGYQNPHAVIGTTAFAVAVTAYSNLLPHWRRGNVRWFPAIAFALPGVIGAAGGAYLGRLLPGKQLLFLFALLMIGVALSMLRPQPSPSGTTRPERKGWALLARTAPVGLLVGMLSGFFGIGGGFLIVPGLMFATGMPLINAIGTSLFSVGMFGTTTAISYALAGLINWVIALEYIIGGIGGGMIGTRLAMRLSQHKKALTFLFAAVILTVALYMLVINAIALWG